MSPRHGNSITRDIHIDQILVCFSQSFYHAVLIVRQFIRFAVMTFAILIVTLIQSAKEDDIVSFSSFSHSITNQFVLRTFLCKVLTRGYAIISTRSITYISTFVIHLDSCAQTGLQTIERRNFTLCLQRRGSTTDGHHLDGILANDKNARGSVNLDR